MEQDFVGCGLALVVWAVASIDDFDFVEGQVDFAVVDIEVVEQVEDFVGSVVGKFGLVAVVVVPVDLFVVEAD